MPSVSLHAGQNFEHEQEHEHEQPISQEALTKHPIERPTMPEKLRVLVQRMN